MSDAVYHRWYKEESFIKINEKKRKEVLTSWVIRLLNVFQLAILKKKKKKKKLNTLPKNLDVVFVSSWSGLFF
jgi:hypothetical protein